MLGDKFHVIFDCTFFQKHRAQMIEKIIKPSDIAAISILENRDLKQVIENNKSPSFAKGVQNTKLKPCYTLTRNTFSPC